MIVSSVHRQLTQLVRLVIVIWIIDMGHRFGGTKTKVVADVKRRRVPRLRS